MSILTNAGRATLAEMVMARPLHLALGRGVASWGDSPPPPEFTDTALVSEMGRKAATRRFFVEEDGAGEIELPGGRRWTASTEPTRHIYCEFAFAWEEGNGETVRELGLFIDTAAKATVPASQTWLLPEDIEDAGTLLAVERPDAPDLFTPRKRGVFEHVLTF